MRQQLRGDSDGEKLKKIETIRKVKKKLEELSKNGRRHQILREKLAYNNRLTRDEACGSDADRTFHGDRGKQLP